MPVGRVWNVEWLNQNANRNYPLSETASMKDTTGSITIPQDFLVDMVWPVHSSEALLTSQFYVSALSIFSQGITITISYQSAIVGTVSISSINFTKNSTHFIQGIDSFFDSIGKVTIGKLDTIQQFAGSYEFDVDGGRLEPTVVRPDLRGVSSLVLSSNGDQSDPITGDIVLEAGSNIRLTPDLVAGTIRIDAIDGEGFNAECVSEGDLQKKESIKTISGVIPDVNGNIQLVGSTCINITAEGEATLKMEDVCSEPCCGCEELEVITNTLQFVRTQVESLANLAARLEAGMQQMHMNLAASKTADIPCDLPSSSSSSSSESPEASSSSSSSSA